LATDEQSIDAAENELARGSGGTAPPDYSAALAAAQHLSSDVAQDQRLPAIPAAGAQSTWTIELSDLAVAAATYYEGFTDDANGEMSVGAALVRQGDAQVNQAEIQGNDLAKGLS
jgi:hypothetical protein